MRYHSETFHIPGEGNPERGPEFGSSVNFEIPTQRAEQIGRPVLTRTSIPGLVNQPDRQAWVDRDPQAYERVLKVRSGREMLGRLQQLRDQATQPHMLTPDAPMQNGQVIQGNFGQQPQPGEVYDQYAA